MASRAVLLLVLLILKHSFVPIAGQKCTSPQYLELGKKQTLDCLFEKDAFLILWYNSTYDKSNEPIVKYQASGKTGPGISSGEYDADEFGVLILNNCSRHHEHYFSSAYVASSSDEPVIIDVLVLLIVKPAIAFPVIDPCTKNSTLCFLQQNTTKLIDCTVKDVKPNISLSWVSRTVKGDQGVLYKTLTNHERDYFTTKVSTGYGFEGLPWVVLLVCKARSPPEMFQHNESMIIVHNTNLTKRSLPPITKYSHRGSRMEISCCKKDILFFAWSRGTNKNTKVLFYAVLGEGNVNFAPTGSYDFTNTGHLVISETDIHHGGIYTCVSGDGEVGNVDIYNVIIFVYPSPRYIVVDGCDHHEYCVLKSDVHRKLTCTVFGIYPLVKLEWKTIYKRDSASITFDNKEIIVNGNGDTFDVTLTSSYRLKEDSRSMLTIVCKIEGTNHDLFNLSRKVDLILEEGGEGTEIGQLTERLKPVHRRIISVRTIIPVGTAVTVLMCVIMYLVKKFAVRPSEESHSDEMNPMIPNDAVTAEFIRELKTTYQQLYNSVTPIPYVKETRCVNDLFIRGPTVHSTSGRVESTNGFDSDPNVCFTNDISKQKTVLIEGEPGYGKSLACLQMAYEWCNLQPKSVMSDVKILILLRFSQLGGVKSVVKAIRHILLPHDTRLSEEDIAEILSSCSSGVVILDGLDEYQDENENESDVKQILERKFFQHFHIIVTTRPLISTNIYKSSNFHKYKLVGFDSRARNSYVKKALKVEEEASVEKIERFLNDNPILSDLCQVPLIFVIFAHTFHEGKYLKNINSATRYFRHVVSCFHRHMKNKLEDNVRNQYLLYEKDHCELDIVSFEALRKSYYTGTWRKERLIQHIGPEFYLQYSRLGILREEETLFIVDDPTTPVSQHIQYQTQVKFFHKLFCEWYAAHHLVRWLDRNPSVDLSVIVGELDLTRSQYMYRFACGLGPQHVKRILHYLKETKCDQFAILCILEQTGEEENILPTIRQYCDEGIVVSGHDSLIFQRSSMEIIKIASKHNISTEYLELHNCLDVVRVSDGIIVTESNLTLPASLPVKQLVINLTKRNISKQEAEDVLTFAEKCPCLNCLQFFGCIPPRSFKRHPALKVLNKREIDVVWVWSDDSPKYILNFFTGLWQKLDGGSPPSTTELKDMAKFDNTSREGWTNEDYKEGVKIYRESLRSRRFSRNEKQK